MQTAKERTARGDLLRILHSDTAVGSVWQSPKSVDNTEKETAAAALATRAQIHQTGGVQKQDEADGDDQAYDIQHGQRHLEHTGTVTRGGGS